MMALRKFDPHAFVASTNTESMTAKAAKAAKADEPDHRLSNLSQFSSKADFDRPRVSDGWTAEDWRAFFDERAAIAEFDGFLSREQAEARAFACCVAEWLSRNPASSPPGSCLGCRGGEQAHNPLLPFGTEPSGVAWLHASCWPEWYADRQAEAIAALAALSIGRPSK